MISLKYDIPFIHSLLKEVKDPEIPVLNIADLGVLRDISEENGELVITITPTYTGCPAMDTIEADIKSVLNTHNIEAKIITSITPAWTTDWMSEEGKRKLENYGIAPPAEKTSDKSFLSGNSKPVRCPLCKSEDSVLLSQFGSTACKALYKCRNCQETFDYFKCI